MFGFRVDHYHHWAGAGDPDLLLSAIAEKLNSFERKIMAALDELETEVSETLTVQQSAIVLLKGLKDKLDAAGTDPVKLKALRDALDTSGTALAEAITTNTPSEP